MLHAKIRKSIRFFGLNIKEKPIKTLFCKILQLVSRLEKDVHGEISLVDSFERKLAIHGYNWNGLNRGDECGLIYSWTGKEAWNEVLVAFYVLNNEIVFSKLGFETE